MKKSAPRLVLEIQVSMTGLQQVGKWWGFDNSKCPRPHPGDKLNCQISAMFGFTDIPSYSFMLHSERLCVFSHTKRN